MTLDELRKLVIAELKGQITSDDSFIYWRDIQNIIISKVRELQTTKYSTKVSSLNGTGYDSNEGYITFTISSGDVPHAFEITKIDGITQERIIRPFIIRDKDKLDLYKNFGVYPVISGTSMTLYTNWGVNSADWTINYYKISDFSGSDTIDEIIQELFRHYIKGKFDQSGIEYRLYEQSMLRFINEITDRAFAWL